MNKNSVIEALGYFRWGCEHFKIFVWKWQRENMYRTSIDYFFRLLKKRPEIYPQEELFTNNSRRSHSSKNGQSIIIVIIRQFHESFKNNCYKQQLGTSINIANNRLLEIIIIFVLAEENEAFSWSFLGAALKEG